MNGMKIVIDALAAKAEQAARQSARPEHLESDGLLHCDRCGGATQSRITILGELRTVRCICECEKKKLEDERKELLRAEQVQRIARLRASGFDKADMQEWTFDADDGQQPELMRAARKYCQEFNQFKTKGKGLLLYGTIGTGKTFTAACIANELISNGWPVLMTNFGRIINRMQERFEGRQEYLDSLNNYSLLIIDDLAAERDTEFMNEAVFSVIDTRYRAGLPLIITTNLQVSEMISEQAISKQRIYSRILERCHPIEVKGSDRRTEAAVSDYAETSRLLGL